MDEAWIGRWRDDVRAGADRLADGVLLGGVYDADQAPAVAANLREFLEFLRGEVMS